MLNSAVLITIKSKTKKIELINQFPHQAKSNIQLTILFAILLCIPAGLYIYREYQRYNSADFLIFVGGIMSVALVIALGAMFINSSGGASENVEFSEKGILIGSKIFPFKSTKFTYTSKPYNNPFIRGISNATVMQIDVSYKEESHSFKMSVDDFIEFKEALNKLLNLEINKSSNESYSGQY